MGSRRSLCSIQVTRQTELPDDPDYDTARERWALCPQKLKTLFTRAFTEGLVHPERRVTEGEWQNLFLELMDGIVTCQHCHAENFTDSASARFTCWHCHKTSALPPCLRIHRARWGYLPGPTPGSHLSPATLRQTLDPTTVPGLLARLSLIRPSPMRQGFRNYSLTAWVATFPDGTTVSVHQDGRCRSTPGQ